MLSTLWRKGKGRDERRDSGRREGGRKGNREERKGGR